MTYAITEIFRTLQGEGHHSGRSAVFLRFAGCNLWSGHDKDRDRDAKRNFAECPRWCDTDFIKRASVDVDGIMRIIDGCGEADLLVFTGGEPLLQLDEDLVRACNDVGYITCVETNGSVEAKPGVLEHLGHVCLSPKLKVEALPLINQLIRSSRPDASTTEIKVVYPAYSPHEYREVRNLFDYGYVSPEAVTSERGKSLVQHVAERAAAEFCLQHAGWALSLQTHKHLDLP